MRFSGLELVDASEFAADVRLGGELVRGASDGCGDPGLRRDDA
ncbi:protein of unknown function [Micropruina glycogenica]|uniref:Uncharacterized protein n=1 Tax=Micropruina glycogenica TaxID=75385 RepID=A0A2N9JFL7_9ACTN|nr:protein of unknown function [Micropruina glycogenica]